MIDDLFGFVVGITLPCGILSCFFPQIFPYFIGMLFMDFIYLVIQ